MHNVWIIVRREYLERVRTKSFWVGTFLVPVFLFVIMAVPGLLAARRMGTKHIAIVASDPAFARAVQASLKRTSERVNSSFVVDVVVPGTEEERADLNRRLGAAQLDGYLWATDEAIAKGKVIYNARSTSDFLETSALRGALTTGRMTFAMTQHGMPQSQVDDLLNNAPEIETVRIDEGKESRMSGQAMFFTAIMLVMSLYIAIIFHGVAVMRSVLEEKSTRIVEVLLATVTPRQLLAGKILGVGAVGLTQMALWYVFGALIAVTMALQASAMGGGIKLSAASLIYFPIFFLVGYLSYSALWAMLGSMVNSEQEAQQLQFFVLMPLILCNALLFQIIRNPDAPLSMWLSLVPLLSPMLMYLRIVMHTPPFWQIGLSLVLGVVCLYGIVLLASRIYRVGILMYGKRPTLPELVKWLRYT